MERPKSRKGRPRKRRFHGNQFTNSETGQDSDRSRSRARSRSGCGDTESIVSASDSGSANTLYEARSSPVEEEILSASFLKLGASKGEGCRTTESNNQIQKPSNRSKGLRLFRQEDLENFFNMFPCPSCFHSPELGKTFSVKEKLQGVMSEMTVICNFCNHNMHPLKTTENLNLRFQMAMYSIGCHNRKGQRFLASMDLPPLVSAVRSSVFRDRIVKATTAVAKESKMRAAEELKVAEGDSVKVACDGTWQRRGFSSKNGVATCLSISSKGPSKVIDTEILTNYCDSCSKMKLRKKGNELKEWEKNHEKDCKKNHTGSAGAMEPAGMYRIFRRSEEQYGLKYSKYLGDGDSKSYKVVAEADPPMYEGTKIEKLECCGHVQKRMGKRLLDKVAQSKNNVYKVGNKNMKGIGGAGKLTKTAIKRIQGHYGGAIRKNSGDLQKMKKAIWAIWHHRNGDHKECGDWCDGSEKNVLPDYVMEEIKPVFQDLSSEDLLQKCLHGGTQNVNESFHHLIWERCPKSTFAGRDRLEIAVSDATIVFNEGEVGRCAIFEKLGLPVGEHQYSGFRKLDYQRVQAAQKDAKAEKKAKRAEKRVQAAGEDSGEEVYQAGGF